MKTILLLLIHFLANRGIGGIEEVNLKANLRATQNGKRNLGSIKVNFKAIVKEMKSQDKINSKEGSESKRRGSRENNLGKSREIYAPLLRKALTRQGAVIGGAVGFFLLSLLIFTRLGQEFIPTLDEKDIAMHAVGVGGHRVVGAGLV